MEEGGCSRSGGQGSNLYSKEEEEEEQKEYWKDKNYVKYSLMRRQDFRQPIHPVPCL